MTRSSLRRTLRRAYWILGLVLLISLVAKLAYHIPGLSGTQAASVLMSLYDYLKDMALVLVTVVAAYLANVFQKRSIFLNALKEEWRNIVKAKSALFTYTQREAPTQEEYFAAFCAISESIDSMRAVYSNVGETRRNIGLYPYESLHDMRRALQSLKPTQGTTMSAEKRELARDAIMQAFYAVRETFLEELDLEAPDYPIITPNKRRIKKPGARLSALRLQARQHKHSGKNAPGDSDIADLLLTLYDKEQTTAKPWREVVKKPAVTPEARPPAVEAPAQT
jgi:hypothetical protein